MPGETLNKSNSTRCRHRCVTSCHALGGASQRPCCRSNEPTRGSESDTLRFIQHVPKICSIICGAPDAFLPDKLDKPEGLIICADKGLDHALSAGITPDIIVGDFDSAKNDPPAGIRVIRAQPEKDDTDTILACETAISEGCDEIRLYCALGGRIDHTIANIQTLELLRRRGVDGMIIGRQERIYLLHERERQIPRFRGYVSVFSYGETCIVSEYGMKYGIVRYRLDNGYPLGVSNEVAEDFGRIIVHGGTALIVEHYE